jgi:hypothetical protein
VAFANLHESHPGQPEGDSIVKDLSLSLSLSLSCFVVASTYLFDEVYVHSNDQIFSPPNMSFFLQKKHHYIFFASIGILMEI